jgi:hypothetical protein
VELRSWKVVLLGKGGIVSSCLGTRPGCDTSTNVFTHSLQIDNAMQRAAVAKTQAQRSAKEAREDAGNALCAVMTERQVRDQQAALIDELKDNLMTVRSCVSTGSLRKQGLDITCAYVFR